MFSLLGRCHGMPAWQKNTGTPVASVTWCWWRISVPWSQVSDRRIGSGRSSSVAISSSRSRSAREVPSPMCSMMRNRDVRSTSVAIADRLYEPMM